MKRPHRILALLALVATTSPSFAAQANSIPGTDVSLGSLTVGTDLFVWGRVDTYPNGRSGLSMSTTSCNLGTVNVPWHAAMQENHPFIAFMLARESNGRLEQISDRSWLKHAFFALSSSQCTPCQNPSDGTFLGVGCSDTYSIGNNGSRFDLGPADEINPWLGEWEATCSFFDTAGIFGCDGARSYDGFEPNEVNHRVVVEDQDLLDAGATYYFYGYYCIRAEPEANRVNNSLSRKFIPSFSGGNLSVQTDGIPSNPDVQGTILNRWNGATVIAVGNGADDGVVFVGAQATDLGGGNWRYNYALHNRDAARAVGSFRVPVSPGGIASNFYFHDCDQNGTNQWTQSFSGGIVSWTTIDNPLGWNSVFNFGFDCNVAPSSGENVALVPFFAGAGADVLYGSTIAPFTTGPITTYCTGKTNSLGCVPFVSTTGLPSATSPDPFRILGHDIVANEFGFILYSVNGKANLNFHNGKLCIKAPFVRLLPPKSAGNTATGCGPGELARNFNTKIQSGTDPALTVGQDVQAQWFYRDPLIADGFNDGLTDAVQFTIGL